MAENIHDKINLSLRAIHELESERKSPQAIAIIESEQQNPRPRGILAHALPKLPEPTKC